jgi:hypothetical protein
LSWTSLLFFFFPVLQSLSGILSLTSRKVLNLVLVVLIMNMEISWFSWVILCSMWHFDIPLQSISKHCHKVYNMTIAPLVYVLQNGATRCTSELTLYRNNEIHCWDRAYDDDGNQVRVEQFSLFVGKTIPFGGPKSRERNYIPHQVFCGQGLICSTSWHLVQGQVWGVRQGPYEFKAGCSSYPRGSLLESGISTTFTTRKINDKSGAPLMT